MRLSSINIFSINELILCVSFSLNHIFWFNSHEELDQPEQGALWKIIIKLGFCFRKIFERTNCRDQDEFDVMIIIKKASPATS